MICKNIFSVVAIVIFLFLLNHYFNTPRHSDNKWTVYGTKGCGWTRKQLDHMKNRGISHEFVDCDKVDCGHIDAFPTIEGIDGTRHIGYKEDL